MPRPLLLWEIKTVNGDAAKQIRDAVGQLLYYQHFKVRPRWPGRETVKLVAYDKEISDDLVDFLTEMNIGAFLVDADGALEPRNELAESVALILAELNT